MNAPDQQLTITVVALGKIGLPLAVQFAGKGHHVWGADVDERVVASVSAGAEPFPGEAHLAEQLAEVVTAGRLEATTDTATAVSASDVVVLVVPLYAAPDGTPDFGWMDAATSAVARGLKPGTLVVYETTLPVGVTRGRFVPALEAGSGLTTGEDLFVAFSPERVLTGRIFADLRRYPKLVGGIDEASAARAVAFYEAVLDFDERPDLAPRRNGVWDLGSAEAAELAKLAETTYRDVNIALVNQFALYADEVGIDVHAVIAASNSQPYSHLHSPGVAVGGHCIPIYPQFYLWGDPAASVVRAAREANAAMPARVADQLAALLSARGREVSGADVVVLGAAYRGGVKETAFSGVFPLVEALIGLGARVTVHDPLYSDAELTGLGLVPHAAGASVDAAVVQADHAEYRTWGPEQLPGVVALLDGRGITDPARWPDGVRQLLGAGGAGGAGGARA